MINSEISLQDQIEKYLYEGNSLTVVKCLKKFRTTELRCIVSRINKDLMKYKSSYIIKSFRVEGQNYCKYKMVKR